MNQYTNHNYTYMYMYTIRMRFGIVSEAGGALINS